MADTYTVTERLWLTDDGKVVKEADPKAATLYATPGTEIPTADAVKYGLVKKAESKAAAPPPNKAEAAAPNKAAAEKRG